MPALTVRAQGGQDQFAPVVRGVVRDCPFLTLLYALGAEAGGMEPGSYEM